MAKFIVILNKIVNYYLYFVVMACFLSCVPNINPNYPLFNSIFHLAGFYLVPPILGFSFSPAVVMVVLALISAGLRKIFNKYYVDKNPKIVVLSPQEFMEQLKKDRENFEKLYNSSEDVDSPKENDQGDNLERKDDESDDT